MPAVPACLLEPLWDQFAALLPVREGYASTHSLGCHRRRVADRTVFEHVVLALVHGSRYERISTVGCSDRTIRRRVKEWSALGISEVHALALKAYDRMIGLGLSEISVDGCIAKAPSGGEKAGRSPVDRSKQGLKRSVASDACGVPLGIISAGANRHGSPTYEYQGIVVKDGKPTGEVLNASWAVGQEVKLSGTSGTFTQQLILVPLEVDPKFVSVTLDVEFDCLMADDCSNGPQSWDGALEWTGADPFSHTAIGKIGHTWTPTDNTDLLDLSTKITAYSPVAKPAATRWQADGAQIRCDTISSTTPGCAFYKYIPTWVMNFKKTPPAVAHAWLIQSKLPNHPGSKAANKPMFFLPAADKNAPGRDPNKNRDVICPKNSDGTSWAGKYGNPRTTTVPEISASDKMSCDEFAYASSYNSGGMPGGIIGGMNPVASGDECVQTYATRATQGEWHLYDDERLAGPTWSEVCGRSAMSGWINFTSMGGAFSSGFSGKYRLLDKDPYWVDFPEFGHCDASKATVTCTVPKP